MRSVRLGWVLDAADWPGRSRFRGEGTQKDTAIRTCHLSHTGLLNFEAGKRYTWRRAARAADRMAGLWTAPAYLQK